MLRACNVLRIADLPALAKTAHGAGTQSGRGEVRCPYRPVPRPTPSRAVRGVPSSKPHVSDI
ncbi:MAG: hypothetical protein LBM98_11685 [Oscillospiraceae bacterium]|nr:hypothetical protein [Oscillospiraceae bacterium]